MTEIFDKISHFRAKDTRCLDSNEDEVMASEQFRVFAPLPLFSLVAIRPAPLAAREPSDGAKVSGQVTS